MSFRSEQAPAPPPREAAARPGTRDRPLGVSAVVRGAGQVLEREIGTIWVEGETASVSRPASGHIYFCLKDGRSQLRAVMWRSDARRLRFRMEDGLTLRCRGRLGIYERDGKFQFYVQVAEPAGLGADALAFEQLKQALAAEGLFDTDRKRPLPRLPRRIGVVTSRTGAAVRDIIRAVQRRYPVPILVADARVQGTSAPREIAAAIGAICTTDIDVLIIGRGGGSAGDLGAFNHEAVVRAVAACPVPTISAVGHEVDVSLTDLAADVRAATPTMAGEMAVPVLAELSAALAKEERRLARELAVRLRQARQEVDGLAGRAEAAVAAAISRRRHALSETWRHLDARHPRAQLVTHRAELRELEGRATAAMRRRMDGSAKRFAELAGRLQALSPLNVLQRGYAIATSGEHVITDAARLAAGDPLEVRLASGSASCRVEKVHPGEAEPAPLIPDGDDPERV